MKYRRKVLPLLYTDIYGLRCWVPRCKSFTRATRLATMFVHLEKLNAAA